MADHPDARLRKREAVRALLLSPKDLPYKGPAALKAMRRGATEPTYSLAERAAYQELAERLEKAQADLWS
ncbi:hypothetical protein [Roseomonas populi]|uniref:Uncharacterized protein n=1 Tax=Roseomonas populi TaxID=3121582 RepID=A0ABT1XDP0_9PROT|nr:hypothetical protein [Roseomonas pecuniae]MCR0985861.1 hypothetical protein [Roseomonas pecuniae]